MQQILKELSKQEICWQARERHYEAWRVKSDGKRTDSVFFPKTPGSDHSIRNAVGKLRRGVGFKWRGH